MFDRDEASELLRQQLLKGPPGVTVLHGNRGVGKSLLARTVLNGLSDNIKIRAHEVSATTGLDLRTLTSLLGEEDSEIPPTAASLVHVQECLRLSNAETRLVAIDAAEKLLDPKTGRLDDYELDQALRLIADTSGHHTTVLLVTQQDPAGLKDEGWSVARPHLPLHGIPYPLFIDYVKSQNHRVQTFLDTCEPHQLQGLRDCLDGNPRQAQLFAAALLQNDEMDAGEYLHGQWPGGIDSLARNLAWKVLGGLNPSRCKVLRAVAAAGIAVSSRTVHAILPELPAPTVDSALRSLTELGVLHRSEGSALYSLPAHEADAMLQGLSPEEKAVLYHEAADALSPLRTTEPKRLQDLHYHFAEIQALIKAERFDAAFELIDDLEKILDPWNSRALLFGKRKKLRGRIIDDGYAMINDNALGSLYSAEGSFSKADEHFESALALAENVSTPAQRRVISFNRAAALQEANHTDTARSHYNAIILEAEPAHELLTWMSALEGLAVGYRRQGTFDQAVAHGRQALSMPRLEGFSDVNRGRTTAVSVAGRLARWYAELDQMEDAERMLEAADEYARERGDGRLDTACLNVRTDLYYYRGDLDEAAYLASQTIARARATGDLANLQQAHTTLGLIYLRRNDLRRLRQEMEQARVLRHSNRSLVILTLEGLGQRRVDPVLASEHFAELRRRALARLSADSRDSGARGQMVLALSALSLDDPPQINPAIEHAQRFLADTQPAPRLEQQLILLLGSLNSSGSRSDPVGPVIEALSRA
jgi:tetratricopeptide (TPR) repeat protein